MMKLLCRTIEGFVDGDLVEYTDYNEEGQPADGFADEVEFEDEPAVYFPLCLTLCEGDIFYLPGYYG